MAANRVKIPTQLRSLTEDAPEVEAQGGTVSEIVDDLEARYPGLKERLLDDSGKLRRFVNIYVNDEDFRCLDGIGTEVPDWARLSIIPAVAGG
ncbi:MAG: MoaD/ThiS family protein [Actinomycetota bacterium]